MKPLISIIVPVYRVPNIFLNKCIESIQSQTYENIEIILVDDGSPDNCGEICDNYAVNDSRIKVIHKKNGGLSAARNTGFEAATGKWFMFVDGDDWIEPKMCEKMVTVAMESDVQLVMCGVYKDYPNYSKRYKYNLKNNQVYTDKQCRELQALLLDFNSNISCAYAKLINKEFVQKNNIKHDELLRQGAEGIEYNIRLFDYINRAIFIDIPLYHYIYNEESISAKCNEENNYYVIRCFEKIKDTVLASDNYENMIENYYNRLIYVIITTAISGYFNPTNKERYSLKVKAYNKYLSNPLIKEALEKATLCNISKSRRICLIFIKMKMYWAINLMAKIRRKQIAG